MVWFSSESKGLRTRGAYGVAHSVSQSDGRTVSQLKDAQAESELSLSPRLFCAYLQWTG